MDDKELKSFAQTYLIDMDEMEWLCESVWMALSSTTKSTPLAIVKGLQDEVSFGRGPRAWKRIWSDLHGKTTQRVHQLCARIQGPKRLESYKDVTMAMEQMEVDFREYERATNATMPDISKVVSLRALVPLALDKLLGALPGDLTYSRAKEYVQEQVASWRDSKPRPTKPVDNDQMDCGGFWGNDGYWYAYENEDECDEEQESTRTC